MRDISLGLGGNAVVIRSPPFDEADSCKSVAGGLQSCSELTVFCVNTYAPQSAVNCYRLSLRIYSGCDIAYHRFASRISCLSKFCDTRFLSRQLTASRRTHETPERRLRLASKALVAHRR